MRRGLLLWTVGALAVSAVAQAAPASDFSVQGVLRDGTGALQSSTAAITINLYDAATAGTLLWGPFTSATTPVVNGLFTVNVTGDASLGTTLANASGEVWLELSVGPDVFPRQKVTGTMFANVAANAQALGGVGASQYQQKFKTPDCGQGRHVSAVAADGTVICVADPAPDNASLTSDAGVWSVAYAGSGSAPTAARSDHSHGLSCTQRVGTANNAGGNLAATAYAQCNSGEIITGGGCISKSAAVKGSYYYACSRLGCGLCVVGDPCLVNNSWACVSTGTVSTDSITAYAMCCTVN